MSLAEVQAAFAQLPAEERDEFLAWAIGLVPTPANEDYPTWFRAKIDAALLDADQRPTIPHEEVRRRFDQCRAA